MGNSEKIVRPLPYTPKQGQYLAFIYHYSLINRRAPAQADMQAFFGVSPPSVNQMLATLEREGLISRVPGQGRSLVLKLPREQLPDLQAVDPG